MFPSWKLWNNIFAENVFPFKRKIVRDLITWKFLLSCTRVITEAEFIQLARYPFIRFQFDHWSAKIAVNPRAIRASN